MKNKKSIFAIALAIIALISVIAVDAVRSRDPYITVVGDAMGSVVTVKAYGLGKSKTVGSVLEQIIKEDGGYWSRYVSDSAVSQLNSAGNSMSVDTRVIEVLNEITLICRDAGGVIDPTIGALTAQWGFDTASPSVPDSGDITVALDTVGYSNLAIDGTNAYLKNNAQLDLGAFGKGIACDIARKIFLNSNIKGGMVSVGGSVLVYGEQRDKGTWSVGLRNPDGTANEYFAVLELTDSAISTSGAYEKGFTSGGVYYHHILSAQTGMPVDSEFKSVSVVSSSGLVSDALSTACFILGYEDSLALLAEYNSEAVFVYEDNTVAVTSGLRDKISISNSSFTLIRMEDD